MPVSAQKFFLIFALPKDSIVQAAMKEVNPMPTRPNAMWRTAGEITYIYVWFSTLDSNI